MHYVNRNNYNNLVVDLAKQWVSDPVGFLNREITAEYWEQWEWWDFEDSSSSAVNNLINNKTSNTSVNNSNNTSTNASTSENSNTLISENNKTSTSTTNNSSIVDNTKTDSTNTINWTTTEEQTPTTTTSKEWSTINLPDKEETKTETKSPSESVSDNNIKSDKYSSKAYNKFKEVLSQSIWQDLFNKLEQWIDTDWTSITDIDKDALAAKLFWEWTTYDKIRWDYQKLQEYYANGEIKNINELKEWWEKLWVEPQVIAGIVWLTNFLIRKWIWSKLRSWLWAILWTAIKHPWFALWATIAAGENLKEWKSWKVNTTNTSVRWALWNSALNMLDNLTANQFQKIWTSQWKKVPRYNTKKQQAEYLAQQAFEDSNTWKWITSLEEVWQDYWPEEEQLAYRIMSSAIATINNYDLLPWKIDNEWRFQNFEYNPVRHDWINKDSWESIVKYIRDLSHINDNNG